MLLLLGFVLLLALMLLLVLLAAIGLGPGAPRSLGPVPEPPRFEAAVGGAQPLRSPRAGSVADSVVARRTRPASRPVPRRTESQGAGPALAVAPAQTVTVAEGPAAPVTTAPAPAPAESQPGASTPGPVVVPPSTPTAPPVVAGAGGPGGPITAGVVPPEDSTEACEGVEYTVTVAFDIEAIAAGRTDAEILLRRVGSDGSESELQLEGGLEDLRALLDQFASEGECVQVEVEPLPRSSDEEENGVAGDVGPGEPAVTAGPAEATGTAAVEVGLSSAEAAVPAVPAVP